jgi:hypothetical protein
VVLVGSFDFPKSLMQYGPIDAPYVFFESVFYLRPVFAVGFTSNPAAKLRNLRYRCPSDHAEIIKS